MWHLFDRRLYYSENILGMIVQIVLTGIMNIDRVINIYNV